MTFHGIDQFRLPDKKSSLDYVLRDERDPNLSAENERLLGTNSLADVYTESPFQDLAPKPKTSA